jgi:DNA-binding NarL/FixJ family response regulator
MADEEPKPQGFPVVLLVDDEPMLLVSIGQALRETCEVHTASTAAEADQLIRERRFDVIICDHMLPGEQGMDFLMRKMEEIPSTRRILLTGYMNAEFISRCTIIAGLSACLVKPISGAEIAAAIRTAMAS